MCKGHAGIPFFDGLATTIATEQTALDDANEKFRNGDYTFVEPTNAEVFRTKPCFADLVGKAVPERKVLSDLQALQQATNWVAVFSKLAETADAGFTNKPPFRELAAWAEGERDKRQKQLDVLLLAVERKFDLWKRSTQWGDEEYNFFGTSIPQLESEYKSYGWLEGDRKNRLDVMKKNHKIRAAIKSVSRNPGK